MKPFLSNCAFCGEPVIRDGTGCHCDCHDKSFKKYLKDSRTFVNKGETK